jgi:predicted porin
MKKSLLAIAAVGAFASAAQAQSSVTVSGIAEAGYTNKSVRAVGSTTTDTSQSAITGGHVVTPVIRFLGQEDLGGGMNAGFTLTQEYNTGTGAFSTTNGFTESFVSLGAKEFGALSAGTMYPATRDLGGVYRFMGDIGRIISPLNSVVMSNTIQYVSPSFQGFSASISNSSVGKTVSSGVDTNVNPIGQFTYGLSGTIGAARVAASIEEYSYLAASAGADQAKNKITSIGGSYDFGVAKLGAAYFDQKVTTAAGADAGKRNATTVNLAAPVTAAITLGATYANYEVSPAAGGAKPKANVMTLAAQYAFSKRTSVYGSYQQVKNSGANNALQGATATGINNGTTPGTLRGLGVVEINGGTGSGFGLTAVHTF